MYPSTTNERDGGYPKGRENGYNREPYDDREWFRRGEFVRDPMSREDRERDFHRHRARREWPEREYRHIDVSPSPKRRKLGREDISEYSSTHYPFNGVPHKDTTVAPYHKPKDYKRPHHGYESPRFGATYRSPSRSPSPPPPTVDKERYPRDYYDRESFPKTHSSYRDRESEYPIGRNNFYRDAPHYNTSMRSGWENRGKYDYRSHNYENNNTYRPYDNEYRNSETRSYDRVDYDRERYDRTYDREWKESSYNSTTTSRDRYPRESHEYDKEHQREPDRTSFDSVEREAHSASSLDAHVKDKPKDRSTGYYSPYDREFGEIVTPTNSNAPPFQDDRSKSDTNSPAASSNTNNTTYDPAMPSPPSQNQSPSQHSLFPSANSSFNGLMDCQEEKPTPKKRLGWGQGLVAFEKEKSKPETPTMETRPPEIKLEEESPKEFESPFDQSPPEQPKPANDMELEPTTPQPPVSITINSEAVDVKGPKDEQPPVKEEPEEPKAPLPSKEDVLLNIEKLDSEIAKTEMQIQNLKKPKKPDHRHGRLSHHDIINTVFEENKEKIKANADELAHMAHPQMANQTVLFKKITDMPVYKENLVKHQENKGNISTMIVSRKQHLQDKEKQLVDTYKKLYEAWKKKIQRLEEKKRRREEKQKQRDKDLGFENEAHVIRRPILRSSVRGGRNRVGSTDAVRSEAEMEEVLNQLRMEEELDPVKYCLKTVAVIPSMLLDRGRVPSFVDNNGIVQDPMALERERKGQNPWSDEEKNIFWHRYLQFPKCFSKIATFLENKNTQDVICYYYMNKKTLDLKKALRDQPRRRPKANLSTPRSSNGAANSSREQSNLGVNSTTPSRNSSKNDFEIDKRRDSFPDKNIGTFSPMDDAKWADAERDLFAIALSKFSKDFRQISEFMGTKNPFQCQNYYHNYKRKYNLDQIAEEAAMNLRGEKASRSKTKALMNSSVTTPTSNNNNNNNTTSNTNNNTTTSNAKTPTTPKGDEPRRVYWTASEKTTFIKCFKLYGKNWKKIAMEIPTKSQNQIRNYFQNYKVKLGLDQIEPQFPPESEEAVGKKRGRKPTNDKPEKDKTKKRRGKQDDKDSAPTTPSANEMEDDEESMDIIERVSSVEEVINITSNSMDSTDLPDIKKESDPALNKELSLLSNESLDSEMPVDVTSEVAAALTDFSFFAQRLNTPSPTPVEPKPQERLTVVEIPHLPAVAATQSVVISQVISSSILPVKNEPRERPTSASVSLSVSVPEVEPMATESAEPTKQESTPVLEPESYEPAPSTPPVPDTPPVDISPVAEETTPPVDDPIEEEPAKETDTTILYEAQETAAPEASESVPEQVFTPEQPAEAATEPAVTEPAVITESHSVEAESKPVAEESSLIDDNSTAVSEPQEEGEVMPTTPLYEDTLAEEPEATEAPAESVEAPEQVHEQPQPTPSVEEEIQDAQEEPQPEMGSEAALVEEPVEISPAEDLPQEASDPMEVVESTAESAPSEDHEGVIPSVESPDSEVTAETSAADPDASVVNTEHQSGLIADSCSSSSAISSTDEVAMIESQT